LAVPLCNFPVAVPYFFFLAVFFAAVFLAGFFADDFAAFFTGILSHLLTSLGIG